MGRLRTEQASVVPRVRLPDSVAETVETDAWNEGRRRRRKQACKRGRRLLTVRGKNRGSRRVPDLRLMGQPLDHPSSYIPSCRK